jgi:hypothetical protein
MARQRGVRVRCPISSTPLNTEGLERTREGGEVFQGASQAHFNTERYRCPNCGLSIDSYYTKERTIRDQEGNETVIPPQRKWTSHSYVIPATVAQEVVETLAEDTTAGTEEAIPEEEASNQ